MVFDKSVKERFDEKWEENEDGCWIWVAGRFNTGYGKFWYDGQSLGAHRISYRIYEGEIESDGITNPQVNHLCHVRECVNPEHLYVGSQKENVHDAIENGTFTRPTGGCGNPGPRDKNHPQVKLSQDEVKEIRSAYESGNAYQTELAEKYGVSQSHISRLVNGERCSNN